MKKQVGAFTFYGIGHTHGESRGLLAMVRRFWYRLANFLGGQK